MMTSKRYLLLNFLFSLFFLQSLGVSEGGDITVRKPGHAGKFYPGDKRDLKDMVEGLIRGAKPAKIEGRTILMIVPHAGYIYSGPVAGYAYSLIKDISPKRIILLGPSHYYPLDGPTLYGEGSFLTPLGEVPVNSEVTDKIKKRCPHAKVSPEAHRLEHSLEVQLPFLQVALSGFEIVPILIPPHSSSWEEEEFGRALAELLKEDKDMIILASSDMSHFHPYNEARRIDEDTVKLLKELSIKRLGEGILAEKNELCGDGAVLTGLLAARYLEATNVEVLSFANSGDTQGDKARVVGYAAIAFYNKEEKKAGKKEWLSQDAEKEILKIARETIEIYVRERKIPAITPKSEILDEKKIGVFVTLTKNGMLRGCIGCFEPDDTLLVFLQKMATASATQDYRFPPLTVSELKDIEIEVSILTPLKKIASLDEFIVGEHGIYMNKGGRVATFLPQVAREEGWSKEETLGHLSLKAGLSEDGWKGAELYIYKTIIIKEEK